VRLWLRSLWRAVVLAACCGACCRAACAEAFIVRDGEVQAEIVLPEAPLRTTKLAAQELRTVLQKIAGAKLPIVTAPTDGCPVQVYVGVSPRTERLGVTDEGLKYGAFRIVSGDNWLALVGHDSEYTPIEPWAHNWEDRFRVYDEWDAITGAKWGNPFLGMHRRYCPALGIWEADERGSFNAVNEFLRSLGARWYFPGELGECLPKLSSVALPTVNRTVRPDFPMRHLLFYYHEFWTGTDNAPANVEDLIWQMRLGLFASQEVVGSVIGHGSTLAHSRDEVKQAHPEYYALSGGKRDTDHYGWGGAPCLSSEGLFQDNVRLLQALYDHYKQPMVSVAPQDGYCDLCECELCKGKGTPERGWTGQLSDYVWGYADRVAREVYETHPDRKVSCIAYTAYLQPPLRIEQFSPNMAVILCQARGDFTDPEKRKEYSDLLQGWMAKLPSKELYIWDYYLHAQPGTTCEGVPVYFPHIIAGDLRALKDVSRGEHIEVYRNYWENRDTWDSLAANHLNCYVTARLYWDANQDVDALLEDYYEKFYGPARAEMKAFIQYAEANWPQASKNVAVIDRLFELIAAAEVAAGDGIYGKRVDLLVEYMQRLKQLRDRLARGRKDVPELRVLGGHDPTTLKLDGKLDDPFWEGLPECELVVCETGHWPPPNRTQFRAAWAADAVYLGIRCLDSDMANLNITAREAGDTSVWNGDNVEVLLETQAHSYYQVAISPAGAVVNADREKGIDTLWQSGVEAAAHVGEREWTLELRIPILKEADVGTPGAKGVVGRQPTRTYPWYFNVCRQRQRGEARELTAFSPTGQPHFHDTLKFGVMYVP